MAWEFWIDRGGTFTDIVAKDPEGNIETHKLLSENPEHYKDAAVQAISNTLGHVAIDQADISVVKMGTTVATNALLERKGVSVLLMITEGFGDLLKIGYQNRPDLFSTRIKRPEPLYKTVVEVSERLGESEKERRERRRRGGEIRRENRAVRRRKRGAKD